MQVEAGLRIVAGLLDPSDSDITAAKHLLLDVLLADFPWVRDADRANYLAALFTPVLRPLTGLSPFYAIDAPERGSGKTLLGVDIPRAVHGTRSLPFPGSNDEMKKTILSVLRGDSTQPAVCFDNVAATATVSAASVAMVLTGNEYTDRILGGSKVHAADVLHALLVLARAWVIAGTGVQGQRGEQMPARRAGLAGGVPAVDHDRVPPVLGGLVRQHLAEGARRTPGTPSIPSNCASRPAGSRRRSTGICRLPAHAAR